MTQPDETTGRPSPPLSELFTRYLNRQITAQEAGFGIREPAGEVVPFEAGPVQPVDSRAAWTEAVAALRFYNPAVGAPTWPAPPDWPDLVVNQEPAAAVAFSLGHFPQAVRNLHLLLNTADVSGLLPGPHTPLAVPALLDWAERTVRQPQYPQPLLALGALRLARQFERAAELVQRHRAKVPTEWRAAWANEEAALVWQQGRAAEAVSLWQAQDASAPVLFNRGMAALFSGRPGDAGAPLLQAVTQIPEESAWHHLGRLYLALAQMRST
jgi:hypothetical protein